MLFGGGGLGGDWPGKVSEKNLLHRLVPKGPEMLVQKCFKHKDHTGPHSAPRPDICVLDFYSLICHLFPSLPQPARKMCRKFVRTHRSKTSNHLRRRWRDLLPQVSRANGRPFYCLNQTHLSWVKTWKLCFGDVKVLALHLLHYFFYTAGIELLWLIVIFLRDIITTLTLDFVEKCRKGLAQNVASQILMITVRLGGATKTCRELCLRTFENVWKS